MQVMLLARLYKIIIKVERHIKIYVDEKVRKAFFDGCFLSCCRFSEIS